MMNEELLKLVNLLNGSTAFTDVIGNRLFPLVALKDTAFPFSVYSIASEPMSKDGREYRMGLQLFFPPGKFTEMIQFADVCEAILDTKYNVGTIETDYSPEYEALYTTIFLT